MGPWIAKVVIAVVLYWPSASWAEVCDTAISTVSLRSERRPMIASTITRLYRVTMKQRFPLLVGVPEDWQAVVGAPVLESKQEST